VAVPRTFPRGAAEWRGCIHSEGNARSSVVNRLDRFPPFAMHRKYHVIIRGSNRTLHPHGGCSYSRIPGSAAEAPSSWTRSREAFVRTGVVAMPSASMQRAGIVFGFPLRFRPARRHFRPLPSSHSNAIISLGRSRHCGGGGGGGAVAGANAPPSLISRFLFAQPAKMVWTTVDDQVPARWSITRLPIDSYLLSLSFLPLLIDRICRRSFCVNKVKWLFYPVVLVN